MAKRKDRESSPPPSPGKKAKAPKLKVMGDSGQTEAERRVLRQKQRSLSTNIAANAADIEDATKQAFSAARDSNNELFEDVNYAREAVMDSENLDAIAKRACKQATKLATTQTYDVDKVLKCLRRKVCLENGTFNWEKLGRAVGSCFNMVPFTQFLNGPLGVNFQPKEKKVRAKREKRIDETADEENPDEIISQRQDKSGMSGMENIIKSVSKTLRKKTDAKAAGQKDKGKGGKAVCAIKLLVNPKSFAQTAENLLALSFAVKKGDASIRNDADGLPVVDTARQGTGGMVSKQSIVALSMKDWKSLAKQFEVVDEDCVPNRKAPSKGRRLSEMKARKVEESDDDDDDE